MTAFFKSITDWNAAAKWLNKQATAITGIGLGTYTYNKLNTDEYQNKSSNSNMY